MRLTLCGGCARQHHCRGVFACVCEISQNDSHLKRKTLLGVQNTRINALLVHAMQQEDRSKPVSDQLNGCGYQDEHTRRIILKRICLWGDYCEVAGWFPIISVNPEKGGKAPAAGERQKLVWQNYRLLFCYLLSYGKEHHRGGRSCDLRSESFWRSRQEFGRKK